MALAMTKRRKRVNRKLAIVLTEALLSHYDGSQSRVVGASLIIWMAAQQGIDPETLSIVQARSLFDSLAELSKKSRDVEGLELDLAIGGTSLGRRWRQIRLKALEGLL